jgi:peptidyl-prolyl cis-trans isomerase A (cyclophilin A)
MNFFFKGLFVFLLGWGFMGCSKEGERPKPGQAVLTQKKTGAKHFLADKPLKLFPKQLSEQWNKEEAIKRARNRARVYREKHSRQIIPTTPDPMGKRQPTLAWATKNIEGSGPLKTAIFTTSGVIRCTLHEKSAPDAVAHFVGLARGQRPWWDPGSAGWSTNPFYEGTPVYKIRKKEIIYAGCPMGTGFASVGFRTVLPPPEGDEKTMFARGTLSLLKNPDRPTVGSQFAILAADDPKMKDSPYPVGTCESLDTIDKIAEHPTTPEGIPLNDIVIERIVFSR